MTLHMIEKFTMVFLERIESVVKSSVILLVYRV